MTTDFQTKYGPWALVAGASEGIGAAFAIEVARRGLNVVLVARREAALAELAQRLRAEFKVEARVLAADLGAADVGARLGEATAGLEIGLLVYNAAYSKIGEFIDRPLEEHLSTIDVNCRGPVVLSHSFGGAMAKRGRGGIILMSSLAGTQGSPLVSTYGATKAFNLVLAEALWEELRGRGVDVIACRAGATRTPNFEKSQPKKSSVPIMESGAVAVIALDALGRTASVVPGAFNRFASFLMARLMPRDTAVHIMGSTTRKMYSK